MEQQLAAMNWKPQDMENRIQELEEACSNKDRQIKDLEVQVDEQVRDWDWRWLQETQGLIQRKVVGYSQID